MTERLVTLVNGEFTNDVEQYFSVRNRPWFLALKLVYNTGAAVGAGYLTALIAGHAELKHGTARRWPWSRRSLSRLRLRSRI